MIITELQGPQPIVLERVPAGIAQQTVEATTGDRVTTAIAHNGSFQLSHG